MPASAEEIVARADALKRDRSRWDSTWEDIRRYANPTGPSFLSKSYPEGEQNYQDILDNTTVQAVDMLATALVSTLTGLAIDWFAMRAVDDDLNQRRNVAVWLEDSTRRMLNVFRAPRGGFTTAQHEKYLEVVAYGTGCTFILDQPGQPPRFQTIPLSEVMLDTDAFGVVDTCIRDFELTASQAYKRWGDVLPEHIVKRARSPDGGRERYRFLHAIYPRDEVYPGRRDTKALPWAECEVCAEGPKLLREAGFHEFPIAVARWGRRAGEIYGRGPGMAALADTKLLQRATEDQVLAAELIMNPPLMVADDGILGPIRAGPRRKTVVRAESLMGGNTPIKPLHTGARIDIGEEFLQSIRLRIEAAFLKPIVMMIRQPRMTATEVLTVVEESNRLLAPYIARLQSEDLGPLIERTFAIMYRNGAFLPTPPELEEREFKIEYTSRIAKAQRVGQANAVLQTMEVLGPLASVKPEMLDNIDHDATLRYVAEVLDVPKSLLRDLDQVNEIRAARAEAMQQENERQATLEAADTASNVVRALPTGGGARAA